MTQNTETRTVTIEREMPHPLDKVWRALTEGSLLEQWLMRNDFEPVVDHTFKFTADWGSVDCRVITVDPKTTLAYSWEAYGMATVVTFTLTPTSTGTSLRMEQSGFPMSNDQAYKGAQYGWQKFLGAMEEVVAGLD